MAAGGVALRQIRGRSRRPRWLVGGHAPIGAGERGVPRRGRADACRQQPATGWIAPPRMPETILVEVAPSDRTTALLYAAPASVAKGITLILGHGAGAPQRSAFMVTFANELAQRGIDTVTFNFLYTEHKRRLPDRNDRLEQCYRAVIDAVRERGGRRLAIGGKSMGGRIASQVAAAAPTGLAGLVFFGYPLHPPGKPDQLRSKHLSAISTQILCTQ